MNTYKLMVIALSVLVMQGCISRAQYTPMTQETFEKVENVEVYNFISQDEARPAVDLMNATGALGGGLIGAMIDSSVNDDRALSAMEIAEPLYNATLDLDFRALHAEHMYEQISSQHTVNNQSAEATPYVLQDKAIEAKANNLAPGEAFLFMSTHYAFVDEFKTLQTSLSAFLFVGEAGKKHKIAKPDFFNSYLYQSPLYGNGGSDSIALWAKNDGALYRQEINNSVQYIAQKLAQELTPVMDSPCARTVSVATVQMNNSRTQKGKLLAQDESVSTVRLKGGDIVFASNTDTVETLGTSTECANGGKDEA